ncbi:MAG: sulfatase-like hydrolase/transferase [Spirochaetia bacterium]
MSLPSLRIRRRSAVVGALLALLGVNASFSVHVWFPADNAFLMLIPRVETLIYALLVLVVVVFPGDVRAGSRDVGAGGRARHVLRRFSGSRIALLSFVAAVLWLSFGAVYSGAEAFFLYIYGRGFVPAADIPMVRGGLLLLFGEIGPLVEALTPVTIILIGASAAAVSWFWTRLTAQLLRACGLSTVRLRKVPHRAFFVGAGVVLLALGAMVFGAGSPPLAILAARAVGVGGHEFRVLYELPPEGDDVGQADAAELTGVSTVDDPPISYVFPGLRDRDIHHIVIESYGYAVFSRPELNEMYRPIHQELERSLSEAGYQAVSGYLLSPVAGGFSWLAEATLMTGQLINTQPAFLRLIEQEDLPSLPSVLQDGGYHTLMVRPGTVHGRWNNEADFYGYSDTMIPYDGDFTYRGPGFSYVPVTDQFAFWSAHQRLQKTQGTGGPANGRPLYVNYQLVSSHTPFNRIPPYLENWEELGDGTVYRELEVRTFDNTWGRGNELDEGYIAALDYVMAVIQGYITQFFPKDDNSLILITGDHQPQRPIRERDAHLSVPIHVLSRDPALLEPWLEQGLQPGFVPRQAPPHPHMTSFFPRFLEVARPEPKQHEAVGSEPEPQDR